LLWFAAPFVFSPAHAGTDHVSTHRVLTFDRMAREAMQKIGVPIADATAVTQSMWEAAWDGLHYLSGSNDNWNGHISNMVFQARGQSGTLRVFPACVEVAAASLWVLCGHRFC
jgi:hypothetical protein